MMEVWIWIGKEQKVIMDDAGTNRLVFSSPFCREGGRERHSHTHTSQGHGCEVLVVGIRYLPWVHGRHAPPPFCE